MTIRFGKDVKTL